MHLSSDDLRVDNISRMSAASLQASYMSVGRSAIYAIAMCLSLLLNSSSLFIACLNWD